MSFEFHQKSASFFQRFITTLWNDEYQLRGIASLPSSHDFEVLQCIVGRAGSGGVCTRGTAVAHCDWLGGQFHETLTQTAQTALLWNRKEVKELSFLPALTFTAHTRCRPRTHLGPGNWHQTAVPKTGRSAKSRSWSRWECPEGGCEAGGSSRRQSSAESPTCSWSFYFYPTRSCSPRAVRAAIKTVKVTLNKKDTAATHRSIPSVLLQSLW